MILQGFIHKKPSKKKNKQTNKLTHSKRSKEKRSAQREPSVRSLESFDDPKVPLQWRRDHGLSRIGNSPSDVLRSPPPMPWASSSFIL